ncbi:ABC transporter [Bradyrhizobium sp. RP6]|nr:ABC transporter [Bradyrhizobium sp. RP6]
MPGLDPGIHEAAEQDPVDGRVQPGHDDGESEARTNPRPDNSGSRA